MKQLTLMRSAVIAAVIIAAVVGFGMVAGIPGINPFVSASTANTGGQPGITGTAAADSGQYIKVDPVADKTTGDLLIITGSTNLPVGTVLMVSAGSPGVGSGGDTMVRAGADGVNLFFSPIDTSMLKPGTPTITVTQMTGDPAKGDCRPGTVKGTASFTLKGAYLGTDTPVQPTITKDDYIRINAIGDQNVGDQFLVTGTTSLPVGTSLIWEVMPDTGTLPAGPRPECKGHHGEQCGHERGRHIEPGIACCRHGRLPAGRVRCHRWRDEWRSLGRHHEDGGPGRIRPVHREMTGNFVKNQR